MLIKTHICKGTKLYLSERHIILKVVYCILDVLSKTLNQCNVGCHYYSICVNHLFYADDSVLIAPSPMVHKQLIDVDDKYSIENEITYNATKTVCMYIRPKHCTILAQLSNFYMDMNYTGLMNIRT